MSKFKEMREYFLWFSLVNHFRLHIHEIEALLMIISYVAPFLKTEILDEENH